jgi:hypothetical protein
VWNDVAAKERPFGESPRWIRWILDFAIDVILEPAINPCRLRMCRESRMNPFQHTLIEKVIVGMEVGDYFAARCLDTHVHCLRDSAANIVQNDFLRGHRVYELQRSIRGSAIDKNKLVGSEALIQNRLHALPDESRAVPATDDDGKKRV